MIKDCIGHLTLVLPPKISEANCEMAIHTNTPWLVTCSSRMVLMFTAIISVVIFASSGLARTSHSVRVCVLLTISKPNMDGQFLPPYPFAWGHEEMLYAAFSTYQEPMVFEFHTLGKTNSHYSAGHTSNAFATRVTQPSLMASSDQVPIDCEPTTSFQNSVFNISDPQPQIIIPGSDNNTVT